jgi:D-glycero-alpha-D-manno-heptose-7-phosphate kinase
MTAHDQFKPAQSNATIRSRAPLRLGFAGGGTDLSPFCDEYGGAVLNCTIGKYAHCYVSPRADDILEFRSCDLEIGETHRIGVIIPDHGDLRLHRGVYNRFLRLGYLDKHQGLSITTVTDVPAGSGLGTSSALVVAVCEALREFSEAPLGLYEVAHLAFEIERHDLALAGGRQDQYAAAFGGVNFIEFFADDRVIVNPLRVHRNILFEFESSLIICFTGVSRESDRIIRDQTSNMISHDQPTHTALLELKESAHQMKRVLLAGDIRAVGEILNQSWISKKRTATTVSNPHIEGLFEVALHAGAYAGKISGAGGGGFMMLMAPPEDRAHVIRALNDAGGMATPVQFTSDGVQCWKVGSWTS